jgi:hypothetical protein
MNDFQELTTPIGSQGALILRVALPRIARKAEHVIKILRAYNQNREFTTIEPLLGMSGAEGLAALSSLAYQDRLPAWTSIAEPGETEPLEEIIALLGEVEDSNSAAARFVQAYPVASAVNAPLEEEREPSENIASLSTKVTQLYAQSQHLKKLGQREEALALSLEMIEPLRVLAELKPDGYKPFLALSLQTLSREWVHFGQNVQALQATKESTELFQQLSEQQPEEYLPRYILSLNLTGSQLIESNQCEEAVEFIHKAISLCRAWGEEDSDKLPLLIISLSNLGIFFTTQERWDDALTTIEESIRFLRMFSEESEHTYVQLTENLGLLGAILISLERYEEALPVVEEHTQRSIVMLESNGLVSLQGLQGSIEMLSIILVALGLEPSSNPTLTKAFEVLQQLLDESES